MEIHFRLHSLRSYLMATDEKLKWRSGAFWFTLVYFYLFNCSRFLLHCLFPLWKTQTLHLTAQPYTWHERKPRCEPLHLHPSLFDTCAACGGFLILSRQKLLCTWFAEQSCCPVRHHVDEWKMESRGPGLNSANEVSSGSGVWWVCVCVCLIICLQGGRLRKRPNSPSSK